jgi:polyisoprenoid-binding protein YceI
MHRRDLLFGIAGAILVATAAQPASAKLGNAHDASVVASTSATGGLKIQAQTAELRLDESPTGVVTIVIPLANLDTGIALRNRHLREKYLQVDKYPTAVLTVARSALEFPAPGANVTRSAPGMLTLHGVTKPVMFTYTAQRAGAEYAVHGSVHVNINDFGVPTPSFLGVSVKPDTEVALAFVAADR